MVDEYLTTESDGKATWHAMVQYKDNTGQTQTAPYKHTSLKTEGMALLTAETTNVNNAYSKGLKDKRDAANTAWEGETGKGGGLKNVLKTITSSDVQLLASYSQNLATAQRSLGEKLAVSTAAAGVDIGMAWAQTALMSKYANCKFDCNDGKVASPKGNFALKSLGKVWGCNEKQTDTWVITTAEEKPTGVHKGE